MGGWSGGVYTRFRNWVTDKANSINPQAANFDQEDDGFAAGLNNCVTKDGLNKPSAPMDWNGQSLTGVLNFTSTGTMSMLNGKLTGNLAGNLVAASPSSGVALTVNNAAGAGSAIIVKSADASSTINLAPADGAGGYAMTVTTDATGGKINVALSTRDLELQTNSITALKITTGQQVQALDAGSTLQAVGWINMPTNTVAAAYTLVLADAGKLVVQTAVNQITIPSNASVPYISGTVVSGANRSGSPISVACNTDTLILAGTVTTGARTLAANGLFTAVKTDAGTWIISGSGLS